MALFIIGLMIVVLGASHGELAWNNIDEDELIYYRTLKYYRQLRRDTLPNVKDSATCDTQFKAVGCYREYAIGDTLPGGTKEIPWSDYPTFLNERVCNCSKSALKEGYGFFSLRMWGGSCVGIKTLGPTLDTLVSDSSCICTAGTFKLSSCIAGESPQCTGFHDAEYIYDVGAKCFGINDWYGDAYYDKRCAENCASGYCPDTHCSCGPNWKPNDS